MKKNLLLIILAIALIVGIFFINILINKASDNKMLSGKHYVEMKVKDYGVVVLELDADNSPITVTNFISLVKEKFYDGLTFHRILNDFMVQGGKSTERRNSITGEFSANGIQNDISHKRGVISMARVDNNYNSASTQFFIMHKDTPSLDGLYASFGHVVSGMEVIDKMAQVEISDSNGTVSIANQPVIEYIKVIKEWNDDNVN